jgi:hypothetical protein
MNEGSPANGRAFLFHAELPIEREEAPAKVDDRGFPTKGVIAGNDHHNPSSTPRLTDLLHHRNDRPIATKLSVRGIH